MDTRTTRPRASPDGHETRLDYHQRLIADPHRMVAYQRALDCLIKPGMVVLDAGAGTGVLAMMAARAGASKVYAVESMPVASLAKRLVAANGLADRVDVIHANLHDLQPIEPVDLIVSDCLGRFLVDDQMLDAMGAAFGWLAPGGTVAPRRVELMVAPVNAGHLDLVDTFSFAMLGLDLSLLGDAMRETTWGAAFPSSAVLAEPATYAVWDLPSTPPSMDQDLVFTLTEGRLVGLAGWFRATLADGIVLDSGPGVETHWHQVFWPVPATRVEAGDRLVTRLTLTSPDTGPGGEPQWRRLGHLTRGEACVMCFDLGGPDADLSAPIRDDPERSQTASTLDLRGAELWEAGDPEGARRLFEAAATRPGKHPWELWDNLGIARFMAGDFAHAVAPLMRALEGEPASREQTLRLLVSACFQAGRQRDGERYLVLYEKTFGPHPAGWRRT